MVNVEKSVRRVLVAGGAGFIGSNLIQQLINRGDVVDCVDNLITGDASNIAKCNGKNNFRFIAADISIREMLSQIESVVYDEIYNLACPTGVPNIAVYGEEMLMTSSLGNLNLLRIAERCHAKYLFASSAEVYGDPEITPQLESYNGDVNPVGPRSAYEEGKRFGESLTAYFAKTHGVDARIIRIFNTYGPNMSLSETRVIPAMLMALIKGQPVKIYGDGNNTRSFQYVTDLLSGFELAMGIKCEGDVFNIGSDEELKIIELFETCKSVTERSCQPQFLPHFIEDHSRRKPDTSKIRKLGWASEVSLEEGLALASADIARRLLPRKKALMKSRANGAAPGIDNKFIIGR